MTDIVARHLSAIDGVFFDFGGVVAHSVKFETWAVLNYCVENGIDRKVALEEISRDRAAGDIGDISLTDSYLRIARKFNVATPAEEFASRAVALDCEGWTNFAEETIALMKELKGLGRRIGVLSNMSREFFAGYFCGAAAPIRALLDVEVISSREHLAKPDPAIYALASARIGIPPEKLLFLDDIERNVLAARACGWRAERYVLDPDAALR